MSPTLSLNFQTIRPDGAFDVPSIGITEGIFFGGTLSEHTGNFHIIDLVTLEIEDYQVSTRPDNMEYDFMHNRIVFEHNGTFYEVLLDSVELHTLHVIETGNSTVWGQNRTYIPQTDQFVYNDFTDGSAGDPYYMVIDAQTGQIVCQELIETYNGNFYYPTGFVTNNLTGEVIAHHEGRFGFVNACEATLTKQTQVVGYDALLNSQMAIYNHLDHTYIIPFIAGSHPNYVYKMGIVDVETDQLLDVRDQPFGGAMNLQEIYDKPIAPLIDLRDTLFVPKGEHYEWYRDGISIGETDSNYYIPTQSGKYSAYVTYREYATFSTEIEITITSKEELSANSFIKMYPNPVIDYLTIENYEGKINAIQIVDMEGKIVYSSDQKINLPENITISVLGLSQGVYNTIFFHGNGVSTKQLVRI